MLNIFALFDCGLINEPISGQQELLKFLQMALKQMTSFALLYIFSSLPDYFTETNPQVPFEFWGLYYITLQIVLRENLLRSLDKLASLHNANYYNYA